jgi:hypothetical protein
VKRKRETGGAGSLGIAARHGGRDQQGDVGGRRRGFGGCAALRTGCRARHRVCAGVGWEGKRGAGVYARTGCRARYRVCADTGWGEMVLVLGRGVGEQVSMRALVARLGIACRGASVYALARGIDYPGQKRNAEMAICGDGAEGAETDDADVAG